MQYQQPIYYMPQPQPQVQQPSESEQYAVGLGKPIGGLAGLYGGKKLAEALMGSGGGPGEISNITHSMGPVETIGGAGAEGGSLAVSGTVPEAASMFPGSATTAALAPYVAAPAAAYTGYKTLTGAKKAFEGEKFDTGEKLAYALPTFGASLFLDPKSLYGSSKGEEQQKRDALRDHLEEVGFAQKLDGDKYHQVELADGSFFNIGRDIGEGQGVQSPDGRELQWFDLNWDNPGDIQDESSQTNMVGRLNPLAAILAAGDDQLSNQLSGYLQNAATSNGQGQENIQKFYEQAGLGEREQAIEMVNQLKASGAIDDWEQVAYHNAINMQFGDDGSGSYDYSKLGGDPSAQHQGYYDVHHGLAPEQSIQPEMLPPEQPQPAQQAKKPSYDELYQMLQNMTPEEQSRYIKGA